MKKRLLISIITCSLFSGQVIHGMMTSAPLIKQSIGRTRSPEEAVKLIVDSGVESKPLRSIALKEFKAMWPNANFETLKAGYLAAKKTGPPPPGGPSVEAVISAKRKIESASTIDQLNNAWSVIGMTVGLQAVVQDLYNAKKAELEQIITDAINAINRAAKKEDLIDVWNKLPDPVRFETAVQNAYRDKEALLTPAPPIPIIEEPKNIGEIIKFVNDNIEKNVKNIYHHLKQLYGDNKITKEDLKNIMAGFGFADDEGVAWITKTSW